MLSKSTIKWLRELRDRWRYKTVRWLLDRAPRPGAQDQKHLVFVRWDGKLGDSIVLSWVYRELARLRPDLQVTVLTHAALAQMHRVDFKVADVVVCSKRPRLMEILRLARRVRGAGTVVHLTETFKPRDFLFLWLSRPAQTVGLADELQAISVKLGQKTADFHFSQKLLPWLATLGVVQPDTSYVIPYDPVIQRKVAHHWPQAPVIGFCPLGASGNRRMSDQTVLELIRIMRAHSGYHVVLLVPPELQARFEALLVTLADTAVGLALLREGLDVLFANIRQSSLIVSVDTAVVHIAAGLNKPQLALYNPDSEAHKNYPKWHPNSQNAVTLFAQRSQPQHIDAIDRDQFSQAFDELLALANQS